MPRVKRSGFTIIELLIVLTIIAVTTIMTAYVIKSYEPDIRLYTASRELKSRLQKARSLTLTTQTSHGLVFDQALNIYQLVKIQGAPQVLETYDLGNNVRFYDIGSFTNNTVSFNSAGAASQSGSLILENSENLRKDIQIKPSGYVTVQ